MLSLSRSQRALVSPTPRQEGRAQPAPAPYPAIQAPGPRSQMGTGPVQLGQTAVSGGRILRGSRKFLWDERWDPPTVGVVLVCGFNGPMTTVLAQVVNVDPHVNQPKQKKHGGCPTGFRGKSDRFWRAPHLPINKLHYRVNISLAWNLPEVPCKRKVVSRRRM